MLIITISDSFKTNEHGKHTEKQSQNKLCTFCVRNNSTKNRIDIFSLLILLTTLNWLIHLIIYSRGSVQFNSDYNIPLS